jgi:nicotinamidase-related amidase
MKESTALLIIDVQNGLFNIEDLPIFQEELLIENILTLLEKARKAKVPIFYIQHNDPKGKRLENGTENWKISSAITPSVEDTIIQKYNSDSFLDTILDEELHKRAVTRLIIAGLATPMCIDTTDRSAVSHGYNVILIQDAHSTLDSEVLKASQIVAHHNDVLQWFSELKKTREFEFLQ